MKSIKNILASILLIALTSFGIVFLLQNGDRVRVNLFHFSTPEKPLWMFVLGAFFVGVIVAIFFCLIHLLKQSAVIRKLKKEHKVLQDELHQLRNQPLEDLPEDQTVEVATLVEDEN
ncbi:MAG: LapA family protein [Bdellovibrionota bacterium]